MRLADFDYTLPPELVAQTPIAKRDNSRLMVVDRKAGSINHEAFYNLPRFLLPTDLLVFNQTKVIPARLYGKKETGGRVEVLLLRPREEAWEYLSKPGLKDGQKVTFDTELQAVAQNERLMFNVDNKALRLKLDSIGHTPLPPYIDPSSEGDDPNEVRSRYQTIYAKQEGSIAAPTAGFHFTQELLDAIPNKAFLTLHVGVGTFKPVKTERIEDHEMHSEYFEIPTDTVTQVRDAKSAGQRVVAVGTTSVRTLETWGQTGQTSGETDIFIYPGYQFKVIDAMITNFHLPKSTLLMLVSAFAGRDLIMKAYQEAIKEKYRFYSFGDAMLIV